MRFYISQRARKFITTLNTYVIDMLTMKLFLSKGTRTFKVTSVGFDNLGIVLRKRVMKALHLETEICDDQPQYTTFEYIIQHVLK